MSCASMRSILPFGSAVFGSRFLFTLHRNVDNMLVGRYLGAAPLGAYALSYNVMMVPLSRVSSPIQAR